jgi:exonuclease SbcD
MASFQFLHCADLHIDSPLRGLEADPDAPADRIRRATRDAFIALVDYAIGQRVAFVLAAGDLYDGDWQDWRTGQFLVAQVGRLSRENIPFIAIRGNHDAESNITRRLNLPEPARLLRTTRPETIHLPAWEVAIHGQSFRTREVWDNIAATYPEPEPGLLNIGILHTSVDGREGHPSYAPCTIEQLRNRGYDYWALGHVHTREVLSEDPWIVFPGNTQGRHAREPGARGATLVTVQDGQIVGRPEPVVFDTVRWARIEVDLTGADNEDAALALVRADIASALEAADGRLLAARIVLIGASPAHGALNRDPGATREKVRAEVLALAGADAIWTESVSVRTTEPKTTSEPPSLLVEKIDALDPIALQPAIADYAKRMLDRAGLREALSDHPAVWAAGGKLPPDLLERARALLLLRLAED